MARTTLPAKTSQPPPKIVDILRYQEIDSPILILVSDIGARAFSYLEHADFLMSLSDEKFKALFNFWSSSGWVLIAILTIVWTVANYLKIRRNPSLLRHTGPSWAVVLAVSFSTFLIGSLWAAASSGGVPRIIVSWSPPCNAIADTTKLMSFSNNYKLALVCYISNPMKDPLTDNNILVSELFTITPGGLPMAAISGPTFNGAVVQPTSPNPTPPTPVPPPSPQPQPQIPPQQQMATIGFLAVLVPKDVTRDKITTLSDLERLGGKILDPRFYK